MEGSKFEQVFGSVTMVMGKLSYNLAILNPGRSVSKL